MNTDTNTYTIPLALALEALALTAPYMATKKGGSMTPALYGVQITDGSLIAADRYGVARYQNALIDSLGADQGVQLITADAVAWIQGIKRPTLRDYDGKKFNGTRSEYGKDPYTIRVGFADNDLTVELIAGDKVERSQTFDRIIANYPPVTRLFPEHTLTRDDDRVGIDYLAAWQLERLGKVLKTLAPDTPALFTAGDNYQRSGKLSPVHVTLTPNDAPVDFLIQPIQVDRRK